MINVNGITKKYGRGAIGLRGVTFTVDGESVAVLGDRGSGKSTLARIICGMLPPTSGIAEADGLSCDSAEASELIGYMPQKCALAPTLTLAESLEFAARLRGLEKDAVDRALEEADMLSELADVPVSILGNAALKRAGLAFALLGSPRYLVLDQPTEGLGEEEEEELLEILRGLSEDHVLVYVSNTVDDARELCDRVLLLSNGKAVAFDSFDAVISPDYQLAEYKIRARGDAAMLKSALSENDAVAKYQVSVTASGTSIIELTLQSGDDAENVIRAILSDAGQKLIELKKMDSPVEKVLSRLYEIQDEKEEAHRLSREERATPVKVTDVLAAISATDSNTDTDDENDDETTEDAVNPRENGKKSQLDERLIKMLADREKEESDDGDGEDNGESTLF